MLCAGVNIKDKDITDIILVDMKSIPNIVQSSARPRGLDKLRIHIFYEFPKVLDKNGKPTDEFKVSEIRNLNFDVVMVLKRLRNHVEIDNEANKEYVKHYNVELSPRLMYGRCCFSICSISSRCSLFNLAFSLFVHSQFLQDLWLKIVVYFGVINTENMYFTNK